MLAFFAQYFVGTDHVQSSIGGFSENIGEFANAVHEAYPDDQIHMILIETVNLRPAKIQAHPVKQKSFTADGMAALIHGSLYVLFNDSEIKPVWAKCKAVSDKNDKNKVKCLIFKNDHDVEFTSEAPAPVESKNIYIGNLVWDATAADLLDIFQEYGAVTRVQVITDHDTGRSRGFGFVEMANPEAAIEALNDVDYEGRTLTVNEAKPRGARPALQTV